MNQSIRFVGMYNDKFEKIVDSFQPGIIPYLSLDEMHNSVRYDIRRWETYKMFHDQLGDSKYAMVKYERATLLTFSLNEGKFLRISIEPNTDYKVVIDRVQNLIDKNPKLK